jgi:hypothetical protein
LAAADANGRHSQPRDTLFCLIFVGFGRGRVAGAARTPIVMIEPAVSAVAPASAMRLIRAARLAYP